MEEQEEPMPIPIYQVDAFTSEPFRGNPAGVCILSAPKDESWMQAVAAEMNLSETAFVSPRSDGAFDLRWFTPAVEVELCGHATLATAHILWESGTLSPDTQARFHTASGLLTADRNGDQIELDFPANPPEAVDPPEGLLDALGVAATYIGQTRFDYLVEVESESIVRGAAPDFDQLKKLDVRGVMITARSETPRLDFMSRFFAPGAGVNEDPVTGSAHCALAPYWGEKLGKQEMVGYQASKRGGVVRVRASGERVILGGQAVTVLRGELTDTSSSGTLLRQERS
jgi:PhzF family phenazine biosynthesis protein